MINSLAVLSSAVCVFLGLRADSTWSRAWDEHAQLIGLLEKRDKESAALLLKTHLVNAVSDVLLGMKLVEDSGTYGNPGLSQG